MSQSVEISDVYTIGTCSYQDKITVEMDDDGIIIHPLDVYLMKEDSEPKLLGTEKGSITILKLAAIALAESILDYYKDDD